nr:protein ABHD11 isoform X1 [Tanacetum cinerariifolium]
ESTPCTPAGEISTPPVGFEMSSPDEIFTPTSGVRMRGGGVRMMGAGVRMRCGSEDVCSEVGSCNSNRRLRTINEKIVRNRGKGDGSRAYMYPGESKPIGFDVSWDTVDGEAMLGNVMAKRPSRRSSIKSNIQMTLVDDSFGRAKAVISPSEILAYDLVQGPLVRWSYIADRRVPCPPTAVLLHGILGSRKNWGTFARRLAQEFPNWQFLLVDLRCHGDSASILKTGPHNVSSTALDVLKLLGHLKITPRVIIGHSFGGKVALSMVEQAAKPLPRPVRVWVLDATPGKVRAGRDGDDHPAELITKVVSKREVIQALVCEGFSNDVAQWVVTNLRQTNPSDSSSGFSWIFDLDGIAEMYQSYEDTNLWSNLLNNHYSLPRLHHQSGTLCIHLSAKRPSRRSSIKSNIQMTLVDDSFGRAKAVISPSEILAYDLVQGPLDRTGIVPNQFSIPDGDKKITWAKWSKILAAKKFGGLGVSSFFALNRALLFRWVWRFVTQEESLWYRVISSIHGLGFPQSAPQANSVWNSIVRETLNLKMQGVDLLSYVRVRVGNGLKTKFWKDPWIDVSLLCHRFPRVFSLEDDSDAYVADKLTGSLEGSFRRPARGGVEAHQFAQLQNLVDSCVLSTATDRWVWTLNGDGIFCVKDARNLLDENFLPKNNIATRWVKFVPIKVNVFAWKVSMDRIPTRLNLIKRGVYVSDHSCPIYKVAEEDSSHLFFKCELAAVIFRMICRWWDITLPQISSYDEWLSWFKEIRLDPKRKLILEGVFYISWWSIWSFRNRLLFEAVNPRKDTLFNDIVSRSYLWCHARWRSLFSWLSFKKKGAAMILKNVSVFTPKPSEHYLNITMRNVVKVFHKDIVLGSGTG